MSDSELIEEANMWKIVRNAATSKNEFIMPKQFDDWLESEKKEERERIIELLVNQEVEPLPAWDIYVGAMIQIVEEHS